jgi:hypothetical protein
VDGKHEEEITGNCIRTLGFAVAREGDTMWVKIRYIKYLFMFSGVFFLFFSLKDKKWEQAAMAIPLTVFLGLLGYGLDRIWEYVNHSPGGTR